MKEQAVKELKVIVASIEALGEHATTNGVSIELLEELYLVGDKIDKEIEKEEEKQRYAKMTYFMDSSELDDNFKKMINDAKYEVLMGDKESKKYVFYFKWLQQNEAFLEKMNIRIWEV